MSDVLIHNDAEAERMLRRVKAIEAKYDRICATCRAEAEHYKELELEAKQKCAKETGFYKSMLFEYFIGVKRRHTKRQEVYDLPSGSLRLNKPSQRMVPNEAELMAAFPEYVEAIPKLKWGNLKKRFRILDGSVVDMDTGAIVQGIAVEDIPEQFTVVVNERMEPSAEDEQDDI